MVVLAWLVVLVSLPLWGGVLAVVAFVSRIVQGRGVFFTQERAGKGGRPFVIYKFRTMRSGEGSDAERLTRFGRFLRRTSIDELPQLVNVLRGEMTLVGPRPLPTRYLPRYSAEQSRRHDVLPGLTGWAQVNGRNALDWAEKFRYDVEYVDRRSFWLDLKILLLTARQVCSGKGIAHDGDATMGEFLV